MTAPRETLDAVSPERIAELLMATADITLVLDRDGVILDTSIGYDAGDLSPAAEWQGSYWRNRASQEDAHRIDELLRDREAAREGRTLYHRDDRNRPIPVRYRVIPLRDGYLAAVGRDMRPCATTRHSAKAEQRLRSVDQTTALVGQVPLRDLVRESTDLIERRCIETALRMTQDNRASAAELLGLSRQSLYSKLRRHGLMNGHHRPDPSEP